MSTLHKSPQFQRLVRRMHELELALARICRIGEIGLAVRKPLNPRLKTKRAAALRSRAKARKEKPGNA